MTAEPPSFDVRFDAKTGILHLEIAGFWTRVTLAGFAARLLLEVGRLRLTRRGFAVLSDARRFPVQAPDVADGFEALTRRGARHHRGRTAIVVGSMLAKMQAERSMVAGGLRVFLDMDEARAWLAEGPR